MVEFANELSAEDSLKFSRDDVIQGVATREDWQCASGRIWIKLDGKADSIRFYGSLANKEASIHIP
jgi:hypothetical protein